MPKCQVCEEFAKTSELIVAEIKESSKLRKDGTPGLTRKYVHPDCYPRYLERKYFVEVELKKLDDLYVHLLDLHGWETLTNRMMVKLQDLRNGSIVVKNDRYKKYKEGVPYELMLQTYKYISIRADIIKRTKRFKDHWNEFSYIFEVMVSNINEVSQLNARQQKHEKKMNAPIESETLEIDVPIRKKKPNDDLDITEFL